MFTGLVQRIGALVAKTATGPGVHLTIDVSPPFEDLVVGESVSVDGACLTAVKPDGTRLVVDVSPETLRRTTLGDKRPGDPLNLERALRLSDRLGGHLVSGHIDGVGRVAQIKEQGPFVELHFTVLSQLSRYLVEKGSVTVDGISLTVASCKADGFSVALIPATLQQTTLARRRTGDRVNIETDLLGKYVEKLLAGRGAPAQDQRLNELLGKSGFLKES
ncbi:MAG: riboflavin synthase [Verrucomicrobia bacterium]|nr:riboflavin synthase [Verrucomicrobiota bacterium]